MSEQEKSAGTNCDSGPSVPDLNVPYGMMTMFELIDSLCVLQVGWKNEANERGDFLDHQERVLKRARLIKAYQEFRRARRAAMRETNG